MNYNMCRVLGAGFWVDFGFWVLDVGYWIASSIVCTP